jgi:hypothetical protein
MNVYHSPVKVHGKRLRTAVENQQPPGVSIPAISAIPSGDTVTRASETPLHGRPLA